MPDVTQVWVLAIDHRHGTNLTVHRSEEGACASLLAYVQDNWTQELGQAVQPNDEDELIETYFERVEDESYTIEPAEVGD